MQLGIETSRENNDYKAICEELNTMKRKYAELEEQSKTLAYEKEHTNNEYHQYVQNLQAELHQTKEEVSKIIFSSNAEIQLLIKVGPMYLSEMRRQVSNV